ncbi:DUF5987 family protein [Streptomyces sp. NPDC026673]|uniref:DUF5987 family protein n=1 Tax=Streptomyces sp. NPDC026673 TaxID=3155724 RepID=UPI0033C327A3
MRGPVAVAPDPGVPGIDRRAVLRGLAAAVAALPALGTAAAPPAAAAALGSWPVSTLEAFADTLIPGERRSSTDRAVAGAAPGPGAVQAGAITLLSSPDLPLNPLLPGIAALLDARATAYAISRFILLPIDRPPFVGLGFDHRTAVVAGLFQAGDPDRAIWQLLSFLVGLAFDTAAHRHTAQAVAEGHPGLVWTGFPPPDADGLWRYPAHSYGTALAAPHPATTPSGSPA